jgi:hypothetical protein
VQPETLAVEWLHMVRALYALQSLFSLWMFIDASQRGAARYWYAVIWLPFGPLVYFFMVKIHDPEFRTLRNIFTWTPKVTLEQLRYRASETPSFVNKLALARGLFDADQPSEALRYFDEILASDDESKDGLYGRALCQLELKAFPGAIETLRTLIELKPSFQEYDPWARLAHAHYQNDEPQEALAVLEELVRKAPRVPHRMLYARYLQNEEQHAKAREQLEIALKAHQHAPRFQKRQDAAAARACKTMLGQLQAK